MPKIVGMHQNIVGKINKKPREELKDDFLFSSWKSMLEKELPPFWESLSERK